MEKDIFELNGKYFIYAVGPDGEAMGEALAGPFDTADEASAAMTGKGMEVEMETEAEAPEAEAPKPKRVTKSINQEHDNMSDSTAIAALKNQVEALTAQIAAKGVISGVVDNEAERPFKSIGEQIIAGIEAQKTRNPDKRLLALNDKAIKALGANEAIPSDGGYAVQTEFSNVLMEKAMSTGEIISRCAVQEIGPNANAFSQLAVDENSRTASTFGGIIPYWIGEGTAPSPTRPKFRRSELRLQKLAALCYYTDELAQDATSMTSWLNRTFPQAMRWSIERAILTQGTGAGQPLSILNSDALYTQAIASGQTSSTPLVYENITKMWSRLYGPSQNNAVWVVGNGMLPHIMALSLPVGTGGAPAYLPANGLSGQPFATLMGRPIIVSEHLSAVNTEGDIFLVDLSQYLLVRKGDVASETSIHVAFTTFEGAIRFSARINGAPDANWTSTLTLADSFEVSPFVTLATRS